MKILLQKMILLFIVFSLPGILCDGHGNKNICDMEAVTCEFYLEVSNYLTMRRNNNLKVYINESDGNVYTYGDESNTSVDPDGVVLADGSMHDRMLTLFNKTMPGPTLTVYVNQEIVVHVANRMHNDGVTVHFHGIEMRGTPWMDGAAFVTQCPILPGQTFTYRFRPNRSGTFFYHSHSGVQVSNGMIGTFIVKERETNQMDEHIMVIQDYDNLHTSEETYAALEFGAYDRDGIPIHPRPRIDGSLSPLLQITSTLINGRGRLLDENENHLTKTPLSVFSVTKGASYRFRVIGGGYAYQHKLSVDGHKLKVVAADGNDVEPIMTDYVIVHNGERFDFILDANETAGNFWIRVETLQTLNDLTAYAILRYNGAEREDPTSDVKICTEEKPCKVVNCPFEVYENWTCVTTDKIRAVDGSVPAPMAGPGNFKEVFINVGFGADDTNAIVGHMNGVSLRLPTVSALTQPMEVTGICDSSYKCLPDKVCHCIRPLEVNFGDVVQINFINAGKFNEFNHPIHVHGYSFHVLKVGYRQINSSFTADVHCPSHLCYSNSSWTNRTWDGGNLPGVELTRSPRKDTIVLPAGGYAVIRFAADNPGLWYIHCHQEMHNLFGMGLLMNDSFSHVVAPPAGLPECRNYPPPDWVVNSAQDLTSTTTTEATIAAQCNGNQLYCKDRVTCATYCNGETECSGAEDEADCQATEADDRTFSKEEFWGMFGALMFVILIQFVLAITCLRRNNNHQTEKL